MWQKAISHVRFLFEQISVGKISSDVRLDTVFHYTGSVTPAQTVMMAQMNHLTAVSDTALQVDTSSVIRYVKYVCPPVSHLNQGSGLLENCSNTRL